MTAAASPTATAPGAGGTIACRWEASRAAPPELNIVIVIARYADATTAINLIAKTRLDSQSQGVSFTKIDGIGEESYTLTSPSFRGVTSRRGSLGLTINIGLSLTNYKDDAARALLKKLIDAGG